ncbi:MAG: transposase [Candidatus Melainabacteria bacterium]|nr:transposase [Candidatus Melainabacteria bacterium]
MASGSSVILQSMKEKFTIKDFDARYSDGDPDGMLGNVVEVDEAYVGGAKVGASAVADPRRKKPVIGIVERQGRVKAIVTNDVKLSTVIPLITKNVQQGAEVMTDEFGIYNRVSLHGYAHQRTSTDPNGMLLAMCIPTRSKAFGAN